MQGINRWSVYVMYRVIAFLCNYGSAKLVPTCQHCLSITVRMMIYTLSQGEPPLWSWPSRPNHPGGPSNLFWLPRLSSSCPLWVQCPWAITPMWLSICPLHHSTSKATASVPGPKSPIYAYQWTSISLELPLQNTEQTPSITLPHHVKSRQNLAPLHRAEVCC